MLHRRRHLALVGDGKIGARPDPAGTIADEQQAEMFRQVIKDSPFAGEVYCKIRAPGCAASGSCGCRRRPVSDTVIDRTASSPPSWRAGSRSATTGIPTAGLLRRVAIA